MSASPIPLESLHPSLWRGSQLARGGPRTIATGYPALSAELPGGGWPVGGLVELLVPHAGCGEMRLLAPGLAGTVAESRPLALVAPPHPPHAAALAELGVSLDALLWLRTGNRRDALWTAEQSLKTGCCGALLFWQVEAAPADVLRRLHLAAARAGDTLFVMLRPLAAARQPSPAVLRLALQPVPGGVTIDIVKRRGPAAAAPLELALPSPIVEGRYARLARHPSAAPAARRVRTAV
ncbi:translesion DNA synthesis-associated protein ImuA [Burkholderia gladioli]|uniref:translesion DNA synthesis-associated protein ImuA n=1 Tax=Burkholderia gladioli TaxID=28095 RepID=UPI000CFF9E9D|nr:translesion DNA synthesis-associated protein ImuA [Burkholderia gladioli]MBJ9659746.1 translesion DNA synthesis-associated protein ImuA [Burkholderia gladioli]PRE90874.1 recombinase RecA [Burkholderia gladioli]